ncbi:MAG: sugar ABC transporter ATP-binding protein [Kofleriaceae bacterium]|nr:sugar ABC transporter ATP-binding protein [Kofleriaceae bacterium]
MRQLVELMTGAGQRDGPRQRRDRRGARDVSPGAAPPTGDGAAAPVLAVDGLRVWKPGLPRPVVDDLSFRVHAGEVVALAGAMGAGRTACLSALFGLVRGQVEGTVTVDGARVDVGEPRRAIAAGLALVPEDRKGLGLVLGLSVGDNLGLPALARHGRWGVVDGARAERTAQAVVRDLRIKTPGLGAEVATLSGGNQQKIVIGKWLELAPRVLLLDEPTRGVDVGAKAEIYRVIEELTAAGHAVILASSDLPEIERLADRVLVLRDGRLAGELARGATALDIMRLALGAAEAA